MIQHSILIHFQERWVGCATLLNSKACDFDFEQASSGKIRLQTWSGSHNFFNMYVLIIARS